MYKKEIFQIRMFRGTVSVSDWSPLLILEARPRDNLVVEKHGPWPFGSYMTGYRRASTGQANRPRLPRQQPQSWTLQNSLDQEAKTFKKLNFSLYKHT